VQSLVGNIEPPCARRKRSPSLLQTSKYDVLFVQEHRLRGEKLETAKKQFRADGYKLVVREAEIKMIETSGGVLIEAGSHFGLTKYFVDAANKPFTEMYGERWVAANLRLKGDSICLVSAYFIIGADNGPQNVAILKEKGSALSCLHLPYVIAVDWQMTPLQLQQIGWLPEVKGHIVDMPNAIHTCGGNKAMFDVQKLYLTMFKSYVRRCVKT
jgi:hypothetical protein